MKEQEKQTYISFKATAEERKAVLLLKKDMKRKTVSDTIRCLVMDAAEKIFSKNKSTEINN